MNINLKLAFLLCFLLFLSACASSDPKDMPDLSQDHGRVIVSRLASLSGMFETVHVKVDDNEVFTLGNGDVNYVDLPSGAHTLHTEHWLGGGADQVFNLKAGDVMAFQTGWFSTGLKMQGNIMIPSSQFNLVQKQP